ncbi:hypothetical protein COMNV_01162 [Commensalibacter sp. Nvir]|uniref:LPS export ABC transporter periplasmic protein LptC n=1 Tax=Commensalibacter sp. Nvir TaxID=3069817 RepID=UPI002D3D12F1|nr:hypothetical protein COMNV_01162 [Commensalibacter sp. Nvir]
MNDKKTDVEENVLSSKTDRNDFKIKKGHLRHKSQSFNIRKRKIPKPEEIRRRKQLIKYTKWILPLLALILLGSIATWPEIDRFINTNKEVLKQLARIKIESGTMIGAVFHGVDDHNSPYTITSNKVIQNSSNNNLILLTHPKADLLLQNNDWVEVSADTGVYAQHEQNLDLKGNVVLYRNDGLFMYSNISTISLKYSVVAADNWIHAEGPFGQLDAQAYFMDIHEGVAQFKGPGKLILNDDKSTSSSSSKIQPNASKVTG